jgi:plastocyanin
MQRLNIIARLVLTAAVAGCSSSAGSDINQPSGPPTNTVSIVLGAQTKGTAAFTPNPITISLASNGVVQWSNNDHDSGDYGSTGTTHNITADDESFTSGNLTPGSTFQATFDTPGTYGYHCAIHPTMKGTVTVTP